MESRRSLQLATISESRQPLSSYAPFYRSASGNFYILVSDLASHSSNLENGQASILLIEDEQDCRQIYARQRIQFLCQCEEISRESENLFTTSGQLRIRHGEIIDTLLCLSDFRMIRLIPLTGQYIRGFGQAYTINGSLDELTPIQGAG